MTAEVEVATAHLTATGHVPEQALAATQATVLKVLILAELVHRLVAVVQLADIIRVHMVYQLVVAWVYMVREPAVLPADNIMVAVGVQVVKTDVVVKDLVKVDTVLLTVVHSVVVVVALVPAMVAVGVAVARSVSFGAQDVRSQLPMPEH